MTVFLSLKVNSCYPVHILKKWAYSINLEVRSKDDFLSLFSECVLGSVDRPDPNPGLQLERSQEDPQEGLKVQHRCPLFVLAFSGRAWQRLWIRIDIFWIRPAKTIRIRNRFYTLQPVFGSGSGLQFLIKKDDKNFQLYFFRFFISKPWIRIHLKCWIRIHI